MGYALYGSKTSPFVRRIRMILQDIPYEFKEMNIFEGVDATTLNKINPVNQIPVLTDGDNTIWDSRVIFNYLNSLHRLQNFDWQDENLLTAIDGAMNAGVALLMLKRSGFNIQDSSMYIDRQKERIKSVLTYLKPLLTDEFKKQWNFHTISLYCFLDWANFREIINLSDYPEFKEFLKIHENKSIVIQTQIPKA